MRMLKEAALPAGTALIFVARAVVEVLMVIICAVRAALTSLPPDAAADTSPSTFLFARV